MENEGKKQYKLGFKITLMIVIMVVLCSIFIGLFVFQNFASQMYSLKGATAQTAADTLASSLDPEAIITLDETEMKDDYYFHLEDIFKDAASRTSFNYLYVLTRDENNLLKVIYGQNSRGTFVLPLGYRDSLQAWNEASQRCFDTALHTYSQPYQATGFGTLISGYAPILDENGNVVAAVGIDISLRDVTMQLNTVGVEIGAFIFVFAAFISVFSYFYTKFRIGTPIAKLSKLSENIVEGNLSYDVRIKSKDEIGTLGDNLMQVKTILQNLNSDINTLVKNAAAGQMQTRALVSNYSGDWGLLLEEMNHLLDTLNVPLDYARSIQRNMLPSHTTFKDAFQDYSVMWYPRDIVGGDIYWMKNFPEGSVLCVCDCTGHGTPGALLTMLVMSAFDTMIDSTNYKDTARTIFNLEQRLISVFNIDPATGGSSRRLARDIREGCDLAVLYIAKNGEVTISSGHTPVYICDGKEVTRVKGQNISVGEGKLKSKDEIKKITVPYNPDNIFYVASDGLYDQIGGKGESPLPFGYEPFKRIILENHNKRQTAISGMIWNAFEKHRGGELRRDDVELITFKLRRAVAL